MIGRKHALMIVLLALTSLATAQNFRDFTLVLFNRLGAVEVPCADMGLTLPRNDFERCGVIPNNFLASNKTTVDNTIVGARMQVRVPWGSDFNTTRRHHIAFGGSSLTFALTYYEIDARRSAIAVIATY